ncbi:AP-4 complex subunit epsilon-1, partial [Mortierella polycephala]
MDFSRKLFSSLAGSHGADSSRAIEDAAALSAESLTALRLNISNPNISTSTMKENMLRLIHGEMMGEDVQFGAIYALKLAQSGQTVAEKRAGYLACYLLLQEGNELNIIESVRKRALIALKNFYTRQPDLIVPYLDQIKGSLYDPEPSVMSAALGLFATVVQ